MAYQQAAQFPDLSLFEIRSLVSIRFRVMKNFVTALWDAPNKNEQALYGEAFEMNAG
jgi:hypothetical protein